MVQAIESEISCTPYKKPVKESVFALVTTAGVHLKTQEVFDVEAGDPTVRLIPSDCKDDDLMISHTHFDRADADKDVNCVFPLTRVKELAQKVNWWSGKYTLWINGIYTRYKTFS